MAVTPSTMLALGTDCPPFKLNDFKGDEYRHNDLMGAHGLVVMFISNHCPFVVHLKDELTRFAHDFGEAFGIVAIGSNDLSRYPQDGPEGMRADSERYGYPFPYLVDEDQTVALAFQAACTPDFYVFDRHHQLVYRGQFDHTRPGSGAEPTGVDLRNACTALMEGRAVSAEQRPATGCNIKWKVGHEPAYFRT
ncbi:MAG: thioredoxin family protein [Myxococcota bacterium]|nr:thioredoxin family protein [Myxococcota bacterium]